MDHRPPGPGLPIEAALVRAAQRGNRAAFDRLARHWRGLLLSVAHGWTRDREEAEDLVQEVLTRAWEKLPTLQAPGAFAGWMKAIMLNACRNWRRRAPRHESLDVAEGAELVTGQRWDPLEQVLAREQHDAWREALQALSQTNRTPFVLHILGKYTSEEIALILKLPLSTVEGRIRRARQQLRRLVRDVVGPEEGARQ